MNQAPAGYFGRAGSFTQGARVRRGSCAGCGVGTGICSKGRSPGAVGHGRPGSQAGGGRGTGVDRSCGGAWSQRPPSWTDTAPAPRLLCMGPSFWKHSEVPVSLPAVALWGGGSWQDVSSPKACFHWMWNLCVGRLPHRPRHAQLPPAVPGSQAGRPAWSCRPRVPVGPPSSAHSGWGTGPHLSKAGGERIFLGMRGPILGWLGVDTLRDGQERGAV